MRLNYDILTKEHADELRKSYTFLQDKSKAKVRQTIDEYHYEFFIDHYGNLIGDKYCIDFSLDYPIEEATYNSEDILDAFEGNASNMWNID